MHVLRIYHAGRIESHRERERALHRVGVDVTLVVPHAWTEGSDHTVTAETFDVIEQEIVRSGDVNRHRYRHPEAIGRLVESLRPDVIDIHEEPMSAALHQLVPFLPIDMPVVCYAAQNLDKRYPPPFHQWRAAAFDRLAGIYPCSSQAAAVLRRRGFSGLVEVIPLGFAPHLFRAGDQRHDAAEFRMAVLGRLVPEKGARDAVRVLAAVLRHRPARLSIAGSGPDAIAVRQLARQLGVEARVELLPWLDQEATAELNRASHLVLIPSMSTNRWVEQFGRTVVEAQACGAVPVAYASGTIPEVAGGGGWLAAEGDVVGLSRAATRLAGDPQLWQSLRGRALAAAADKTWDAVGRQQLAFYEAIVRPHGPRAALLRMRPPGQEMPARTANGQLRPYAMPVLRQSRMAGDVGGAVADRLSALVRRSTTSRLKNGGGSGTDPLR